MADRKMHHDQNHNFSLILAIPIPRIRICSKSPFNVIAEDFTLKNFTESGVANLYVQHTTAIGQIFKPEVIA